MTETTHLQSTPPGAGAKPHSPEYRVAVDSLRGLRQDLIQDAFAYRPLPGRRTDGRFARRLPGRLREYTAWTPHALIVAAALITVAFATVDSGGPAALMGLFCAVPVLLTMVRPVAAFWASMISTLVVALVGSHWGEWPWAAGSFACHLIVLTVVAMRTRPRTAGWMWALTALYAVIADSGIGPTSMYGSNSGAMLIISALILLCVTVRHIRRDAVQEVTAQQTVTAHERSRRTLLEERTTIARELHDVVAHHMSVVAIQAEAAPYRVENPPPELEKAFATIRENAVAALTELRRVLGVVRAEDYEAPDAPQPTLAELDGLLANVRDAGLSVDKAVTGAVRELPQGVELSAYRIVQEALSNTLRHAPGATARVEIGYVLGGLGLRIVNGPPPNPSLIKPSPGAGHGVTGMRERVSMLNGEMTAGPVDDGGYEVAVFLPVALPDEGDA
ncbi:MULTISPECIES: sensor histidine kinase [Streptomyces]|uniref:histidine kinase n=1 Tax=Streptomyces koelreuteriae TaxID=2838015 RepID=A0ABX8FSF0_9ACTN|nr:MULTISPECIES: histidine kinase [Streptomyces]QWB24133.1 two-component sensor histidine kinase [Streptomyces koelreuteriae]UUA07121.1 histidine kinase [Streptomyces koelreuteriae]UUA14750.1 histidine kinase [Streptomyces sp. CRCS-T-1]